MKKHLDKRLAAIEAKQPPPSSNFDASKLSTDELRQCVDIIDTGAGGTVETVAYGSVVIPPDSEMRRRGRNLGKASLEPCALS